MLSETHRQRSAKGHTDTTTTGDIFPALGEAIGEMLSSERTTAFKGGGAGGQIL